MGRFAFAFGKIKNFVRLNFILNFYCLENFHFKPNKITEAKIETELVTIIEIWLFRIPYHNQSEELTTPMIMVSQESSSVDFSFNILNICGIKSDEDKPPATKPIISGLIFSILRFFCKLPFHPEHNNGGKKYNNIGKNYRNTVFENTISNPNYGTCQNDEEGGNRNIFYRF